MSEFYDEFVFCDPTEANLKRLNAGGPILGRSLYAEYCTSSFFALAY